MRVREMQIDISLIGIGGEDESLLQQLINDECNSKHPHLHLDLDNSTIDFSCSPLQTFRSKRSADPSQIHSTNVSNDDIEPEMPSCASPKDMNNKENLNKNNLGTQSSTDEPQKIKRRKKGGGYNLRKSLAWNKAFSTEEGVLNPLELSILSGSLSKFGGKFLSGIPEEGVSLLKGSDLSGDESDLQVLDENVFNELPERSLNEDQKVGGGLLPKTETLARQDAAPVIAAPRKLQVAKGINKIVSQGGGCPRPLGSSSQKRLPNTDTTNIRAKDSKLPKFSVSKQESSSVSTSSRVDALGARRIKINQNTPSVSVKKNRVLKGSTINTKTASDSTSSSAKSFVFHPGKKNMASSSSVTDISTNLRPPQARKGTTTCLKANPDPVLCAHIRAPTGDSGSSKSDFSISQDARHIGANIPRAKFQPTKPSGLRMPSPSLGLFDQAKASSSHNIQSLRNSQSNNLRESSVPNPRKLSSSNHIDELKSLHVPAATGRLTKGGNDAIETGTSTLSSTLKCSITSTAAQALHSTMKSSLDLKNSQLEARAQSNHLKLGDAIDNSEPDTSIVNNHYLRVGHCVGRQFGEHAELRKPSHDEDKKIQPKENHRPQMNNSILVEESRCSEESSKDNDVENSTAGPEYTDSSGTNKENSDVLSLVSSAMQVKEGANRDDNKIKIPQAEDSRFDSLDGKLSVENHDLFSAQFRDVINSSNSRCLRVGDNADEQSGEAVPIKTCPEKIQHKIQTPQINNSILVEKNRSFEESPSNNDLGNIMVSPESRDSSGSEMGSSDELPPVISEIQVNEGRAGVDNMMKNPQTEYIQFESLNSNSSIENHDLISDTQFRDATDNGNPHSCLIVCDHIDDQAGEKAEPMKPFPDDIEHILHKEDHELQMNDNILLEQSKSSEESQKDYATDNGNPHSCLIVCAHIDDQAGEKAEPMKPFPDDIEHILHKEDHELQMNDNILLEQSKSSEESQKDYGNLLIMQDRSSEESDKDNELENANNASPESSESSGSESKSSHVLSQLKPAMQMIGVAGTENKIKQPLVEDVELESLNIKPSVENSESISDRVFGHVINHSDQCTLGSEPSLRSSKDQHTGALITCSLEAVCSSTETLGLSVQTTSNESIPQGVGSNGLKNNISFDETETDLSENSKIPNGELQNGVFPTEDEDSTRKSLDDSKQDALAMKYKLNAVPFSDEWLAALEAAGEDILTMKTGSVQNSPPEKSLPEPGPWSPVKRKSNQEIGPFDCTKYTNLPPPNLH